jgi:excinuclease UvrABC nuclease subunit
MERLTAIGFRRAGEWVLDGEKIRVKPDAELPEGPALYAFVTGKTVRYVGKTIRSLADRMQNYRNPDPTQPTNERVNKNIRQCLGQHVAVDIYALAPVVLEDSLIDAFKPEWNKSGT